MHISFTSEERAAIKLAALMVGAPSDLTFVRDCVARAVHDIFDDADDGEDLPIVSLEKHPERGKDILAFTGKE